MHSAPSSLCSIALYSLDHETSHIVYSVIPVISPNVPFSPPVVRNPFGYKYMVLMEMDFSVQGMPN